MGKLASYYYFYEHAWAGENNGILKELSEVAIAITNNNNIYIIIAAQHKCIYDVIQKNNIICEI